MKKITELTEHQTSQMSTYRDKWIKIGLSTELTNKERAIANVPAYYKAGGLKPPKNVVIATSPLAAMIITSLLKSSVFYDIINNGFKAKSDKGLTTPLAANSGAVLSASAAALGLVTDISSVKGALLVQEVASAVMTSVIKVEYDNNYAGGNLWSGWLGFYDYFAQELKVKNLEILDPTIALAQDCGWILSYEHLCILVEKPQQICMESGRLHHETAPAVRYSDGFSIYSLNGVQVPTWLIETPKHEIKPDDVLALTNTEQRAAAMRFVGLAYFLDALNAKELDVYNGYKLYSLNVEGQKIGPYLYMTCPSSGRQFLEGVGTPKDDGASYDPTIKTCKDALKWRAQKASNDLMTKFNLKWTYSA